MANHRSSILRVKVVAGFTAASLVLALAGPVFAQTTADKEQAKALVVEGRKLRDEQKDHKGALQRFEAAYKLVKTPIIGLDLAREYVAVSMLVESYGVCDEIGRIPTKDTESAESKGARANAETLRADLKARIPTLSITMKPHADSPTPVVLLDGAELGAESMMVPRAVNPGDHTLVVRVVGATATTMTVTVAERETKEVALEVPLLKPVVPTPEAAASTSPLPPPHVDESSRGSGLRLTGVVLGSTGLVTMGVGGILALSAKSKASGANCDGNNSCATPADVDQRHSAVQQANLATIVVGVGALLTLGGAVLWLTAPSVKSDGATAVKPRVTALGVGPTGLVMSGQF